MRDDERDTPAAANASDHGDYRPSGAIAVTLFLAATIVVLWGFIYILSLVRG